MEPGAGKESALQVNVLDQALSRLSDSTRETDRRPESLLIVTHRVSAPRHLGHWPACVITSDRRNWSDGGNCACPKRTLLEEVLL